MVRTYQVTFCEYTVFPDYPEYVNRFSLRRENGEPLSDQINMVMVELSKLGGIIKKPIDELTLLEMWSAFFRYASDNRQREFINKVIDRREEFGMAGTLLMEISKDEQERARLRSRRMAETDAISNLLNAEERGRIKGHTEGKAQGIIQGITQGIKQGITQGIAQGINQGVFNVAVNMKKSGMSDDDIIRLTGLSLQEIEKL
jgi:predicted transposase/invertase (TIGR01784 family)